MLIAGLGCRRDCDTDTVCSAVAAAVAEVGRPVDALATAAFKIGEPGLRGAADRLGLELFSVSDERMRDVQARCVEHSAVALRATGFASIGEAAALAVAGPGSRLLLRATRGGAVCALVETS